MPTSRTAFGVCSACRRAAAPQTTTRGNASRLYSAASRAPRLNTRENTIQKTTNLRPAATSSSPWASQHRSVSTGAAAAPSTSASQQSSPPQTPTYYALFPQTFPVGAPPAAPFAVDVRALRREFLQLQAASHPDFHHSASGEASATSRVQAEATSALINEAYRTLASPLLRAQYLLRELHGADLAGDESGSMTAVQPEVLMTVLEAREAVEEAECEEDLEGLRAENEGRIADAEQGIAVAFERGDVEAAKRETVRLRYWMGIRESVHNWEKGKGVVLQH